MTKTAILLAASLSFGASLWSLEDTDISGIASDGYEQLESFFSGNARLESAVIEELAGTRDTLLEENSIASYLLGLGLNAGIQDALIVEQLRTPLYYPNYDDRVERLGEIQSLFEDTKIDESVEIDRMFAYESNYAKHLTDIGVSTQGVLDGEANSGYFQTYSDYVDNVARGGPMYFWVPTDELADYTFVKLLSGLQRQRDIGRILEFSADFGYVPRDPSEFRRQFTEFYGDDLGQRLDTGSKNVVSAATNPVIHQILSGLGRVSPDSGIFMYL